MQNWLISMFESGGARTLSVIKSYSINCNIASHFLKA